MVTCPWDVDLATALDVVFLGAILLAVTQFARSVAAHPGGTPHLLRLSADAGIPATAPELGLLRPAIVAARPGVAGLGIVVPAWLGLLWERVGRPV